MGEPRGLYCTTALTQYNAQLYGANKELAVFSWSVGNADTLMSSGNSVFDNLAGNSGIDVSTDYVDFGLPFFLGQTVFVGFAGTTFAYPQVTNPVTYANGFWAF